MDMARADKVPEGLHPYELKRLENEESVCDFLEKYRNETFENDPYITSGLFIEDLKVNFTEIVPPAYLRLLFAIEYLENPGALDL